VMDSSKSGRTIYVVAAGLIVVSTTIMILQLLQLEIIIAVETSAGIVPIVGLLSLLLWITQPDRRVIEHYTLKYIYKREELAKVKVRMASALLYIMPWESSPKNAFGIEESLQKDLERTLRSPELKDQIDNYKQAFWLLLLTPFSLITLVVFYTIPLLLLLSGGIGIGCILAYLLLRENQHTLTRIIEYAFARWFQEDTSTDLSRRKSGFGKISDVKERLEATLEIVTPTIDLAVRGDWRGFDRQSRNLEELLGIPNPEGLLWRLVNDFLRFLQWSVGLIHGPNSQRVDICLQNAELQITDSITVIRENRESSFSEEETTIADVMGHFVKLTSSRDSVLNLSAEFYSIFNEEIFENILSQYFDILKEIPFSLNKLKIPNSGSEFVGVNRLAFYLVAAAEKELLDMIEILKLVALWKVHPTVINGTLGPLTAIAIMENNVGWNLDEIQSVVSTLAARMEYINFDKMLENLKTFGEREQSPRYRQFISNLRREVKKKVVRSEHDAPIRKIGTLLEDYYLKLKQGSS